jgi:hypothetical protein
MRSMWQVRYYHAKHRAQVADGWWRRTRTH